MVPGTCLRQTRERLGLTYRDVERSSYEVANHRGRPGFIVRVSRLADIENSGVTPNLYKLYSLCTIYHLDIFQVCDWYAVRLRNNLRDALEQTAPNSHLLAAECDRRADAVQASLRSAAHCFHDIREGGVGPIDRCSGR